jgi:hypothetical protein
MIYSKAQPADSNRSGGLTERDTQAKPPQQIPADVLRRLERSLETAKPATVQTPQEKK